MNKKKVQRCLLYDQPNGVTILLGREEAVERINVYSCRCTFHSDSGWEYQMNAYRSRQELVRAIENFIRYYNNDRIKEKLGGLSPKQYRERMKSA